MRYQYFLKALRELTFERSNIKLGQLEYRDIVHNVELISETVAYVKTASDVYYYGTWIGRIDHTQIFDRDKLTLIYREGHEFPWLGYPYKSTLIAELVDEFMKQRWINTSVNLAFHEIDQAIELWSTEPLPHEIQK